MNKTIFGPLAAGLISAGTFLGVTRLIRREKEEETSAESTETVKTAAEEAEVPALPQQEEPRTEITGGRSSNKKLKCWEVTDGNDIRYKGFLSYRYLKIAGWVLIVIACFGSVLSMYVSVTEDWDYMALASLLQFGKDLSIPLLLIAVFATILNGRVNYKRTILTYTGIAAGLIALSFFIYSRYLLTGGEALMGDRRHAAETIRDIFTRQDSPGFLAFNIFIDILMCTLVMFFTNYRPKRFFTGWRIYIFRALVFVPIAYETACICLKILASARAVVLPIWVFPLLTTKPPMSFLLFVSIARYFRNTERLFRKAGKTHGDYEEYLKTNHNSFRFSKYLAVRIVVFAILDVMAMVLVTALYLVSQGQSSPNEAVIMNALDTAATWGFGQTVAMVPAAPLMLLFSYTKTHKSKLIDLVIPLAGVAGVVAVYADGLFQVLCAFIKNSGTVK